MRLTRYCIGFASTPISLQNTLWKVASLMLLSGIALSGFANVGISPSGAATYSFGITVPPGVAGVEPKITLNYSSQAGAGLLGMGWSLGGLSSITRCPKTFLQDGFDRPILDSNGLSTANLADDTANTTDAFCLDGQRLIKFDPTGSNYPRPGLALGEYRLEREGYSRITFNGTNQWTVETKSGNVMVYGDNVGTRIPGANSQTRTWLISSINDRKTNTITFSYSARDNDRWLDTISYGPANINQVKFIYDTPDNPRSDTQESWLNGVRNLNDKRFRMIQIIGKNASNQTVEIRRYLLSYNLAPNTSSITKRSLLSKIQECVPVAGQEVSLLSTTSSNATSSQQKCLAPIKLGYGVGLTSWGTSNGPNFSDSLGYSDSAFHTTFQFVDVDGDAYPDLCYRDTTTANGLSCKLAKGWNSTGLSSWSDTSWISQPTFSTAANFANLQFVDINRDGKVDACSRFSDGLRCYLNSGNGFNGGQVTASGTFNDTWAGQASSGPVTFLDLNNDGYPDVCGRGQTGLQCFFNTQGTGFTFAYTLSALNDSATNASYSWEGYYGDDSSIRYKPLKLETYSSIRYIDINSDGYIDACAFLPGGQVIITMNGTDPNTGQALYTRNDSRTLRQYCWLNNKAGTFSTNIYTGIQFTGPEVSGATKNSTTSDGVGGYVQMLRDSYTVDLNSDGHPDYCLRSTTGMRCWINQHSATGNPSMVEATINGLTGLFPSSGSQPLGGWDPDHYSSTIQFVDLNSDSRPDICGRSSLGLQCWINTPTSSGTPPYTFVQATSTNFANLVGDFTDLSGYSSPGLYKTLRYFSLPNGRTAFFMRIPAGSLIYTPDGCNDGKCALDQLTSIKAGAAPQLNISYGNGVVTSGLYTKGTTAAADTRPDNKSIDIPAAISLVSSIGTSDPTWNLSTITQYNYAGLVAQFKRGLLGFKIVRSKVSSSQDWVETVYSQYWPFIGLPNIVNSGNSNTGSDWPTNSQAAAFNGWIKQSKYKYSAIDLLNNPNMIVTDLSPASSCSGTVITSINQQLPGTNYLIYPPRVIETVHSVNNLNNTLSTITTDTVIEKAQGNTVCIAVKATDVAKNLSWEKITNNTYDTSQWPSGSNWILGRLTQSLVTSKSPSPSTFYFSPTLAGSQGGYPQISYNPNTNDGSLGPVYPDVAPWLTPVTSFSSVY